MTRSWPPIPKLSSADTPPEKSRDCLPVSTIAESGVITRMPLVCMSIVASAFQYGWAPTVIPATTLLIPPPVRGHLRAARGVQERGRSGVPVALRTRGDPGAHDVGLTPGLGEFDDSFERGRGPVHVLGARGHRDPGSGREGEPFRRDPHPLG